MTDAAVSEPTDSGKVRLLVWDDPDVRARTADVLVADAPADAGPDLERVYLWLLGRCAPSESAEACLFTTVRRGEEEAAAALVTRVRLQGFAVLVRPEAGVQSTLSAAMLAHVERLADAGQLAEVIVASHDAGGLAGRLATIAARGIAVTVLGFRERASYAVGRDGISFVDLEEVPGAYHVTLPRTNLFDLPLDGRALPPLRLPQLPALNPAPQPVPIPPTSIRVVDPAIAAPPPPAPTPSAAAPAAPEPTPQPDAAATGAEPEVEPVTSAEAVTDEPALAPFPPAPPAGVADRLPAGLPAFAAPPPAPAPLPTIEPAPAAAPSPAPSPAAEPEPATMAPPPPPPAPPVPPWRTTSPVTATPINPGGDDNSPRPGRVSPPNGL